jgi:hypothetical protein
MGKLPAGVDPLVLIFNTVEHAGVQEVEEKDPVAPEGSPKIQRRPILSPELAREKPNGWLTLGMTGVTV